MTNVESLKRIDAACSRFESGGRLGPEAIEPLITAAEESDRADLARELIALDAELRQQRGDAVTEDDYSDLLAETDAQLSQDTVRELIRGERMNITQCSSDHLPSSPRYQFSKLIGSGAYGDVWRVNDVQANRPLAVKVLRLSKTDDPNATERFRREAMLTGRLQHPGVPPVYDHGTLDDGSFFYSMKLVGGRTLEEIFKSREGDDDSERVLSIFEQLTQTVSYAHSQGVIHRDLKPHNVMVGDFGEVQVMDWGMAKALEEKDSANSHADTESIPSRLSDLDTSLTSDGDVMGTPAYMSPEQARGQQDALDARSDVFSLGTILFQILTGKRIHQNIPAPLAIHRTASGELGEPLAALDACGAHDELKQLCRHCLEVEASHRPSDAAEVSQRITDHLASAQQRARQAELDRRELLVQRAESAKRRVLQVGAATVIAIVSMIGAGAAYWQREKAVDASEQAVEAREETSGALALADERLAHAHDVVEEFFVDVSDERGTLAQSPESQAVRQKMIEKAIKYYESFLADSGDDPRLKFKIARSYLRLSTILSSADPGGKGVKEYLNQAIEICDQQLAQNPEHRESHEIKATAKIIFAQNHFQTKNLKEAESCAREAVELARFAAESGGNDDNHFGVAKYLQNLGLILEFLKRNEEAEDMYREAIKLASEIQSANPDNADYAHQLGRMHNSMGILANWGLGQRERGLKEMERAIQYTSIALDLLPTRIDMEFDRSKQHMNATMILMQSKQNDRAKEAFESTIQSQQRIVQLSPLSENYRQDLARVQHRFATFCLSNLKDTELATKTLEDEIENYRVMTVLKPKAAHYRESLANTLNIVFGLRYASDAKSDVNPSDHYPEAMFEIRRVLNPLDQGSKLSQRLLATYWQALDPREETSKLLERTKPTEAMKEAELKELGEFQRLSRALALIRSNRHGAAAAYLEKTKSEKPSTRWKLVNALATLPKNRKAASDSFKASQKRMRAWRERSLDQYILLWQLESALNASSPQ